MNRPFLFCAGEWGVTQPLVFKRDRWQHTSVAKTFELNDDGTFRRWNLPNERLEGLIFYASVHNKAVRQQVMDFVVSNNVTCWPDVSRLRELDCRFKVLKECVDAGFVDHPVVFSTWASRGDIEKTLGLPYVLKVGNLHQGEGKHLIHGDKVERIEEWDGVASAEPYFMGGTSARALFIGDNEFALRFDNPTSWIKNSAGADVATWPEAPKKMWEHARRVHRHFGLEVSGIDYVIEKDGTPRFLEFNHFPGVGATDEIAACASEFFGTKMNLVESLAASRREQNDTRA